MKNYCFTPKEIKRIKIAWFIIGQLTMLALYGLGYLSVWYVDYLGLL